MEMQINWGLKLSLEQMALRRMVANVLMESDILALIEKCQFDPYSDSLKNIWRKFVDVENIVKVRISKMALPESLKKQMVYLVRPMGSDMLKWKAYHEQILDINCLKRRILKRLCWTCTGIIDYQNTAKNLLRPEVFCTNKSYKLACLYCLVDDIKKLWKRIPNSMQTNCEIKKIFDLEFLMAREFMILEFMTDYWCFHCNGADSRLNKISKSKLQCSFYQHAFKGMACRGNKAATEYFFQKLPQEEQDSALFSTVCKILNTDSRVFVIFNPDYPSDEKCTVVISYLFSLMNSAQKMRVFKEHPVVIFLLFLNWPWQDLFLEIADVIWTILPESKYHELFLIEKNLSVMVNYFPNFFSKFFLRCPSNVQKHLLEQLESLFFDILKTEDTDNIKAIFRSIDIEDRVRIISDSECFRWFDQLLMTEKWHLIQLCIQEATISKEELERLKFNLIDHKTHFSSGELTDREVRLRKRKWVLFFQFLDAANVNSLHKRGYEGDMMNKTKKLCYLGKE